MSRIPLVAVERQPEPIREFMARRGALNAFRMLANAPEVFAGWAQLLDELSDSPTFTVRARELVMLRVARLQKCRYELSRHIGIAQDAGFTEQQISAVVETDDFDEFDDTERLLLEVVTELCATRRLGDATFAKARSAFSDEELTELLMLVSCYYGLALVLNAADLEVEAR